VQIQPLCKNLAIIFNKVVSNNILILILNS